MDCPDVLLSPSVDNLVAVALQAAIAVERQRRSPMQHYWRLRQDRALRVDFLDFVRSLDSRMQVQVEQRRSPMQHLQLQEAAALRAAGAGGPAPKGLVGL